MSDGRVSPFSNGTEFSQWVETNCDRCTRAYDEDAEIYLCPIQEALDMASLDDGTVDADVARRMGFGGGLHVRRCREIVPA